MPLSVVFDVQFQLCPLEGNHISSALLILFLNVYIYISLYTEYKHLSTKMNVGFHYLYVTAAVCLSVCLSAK